MIKNSKIVWKLYSVLFCLMAAANLIWLLYPASEPYIFYHILISWTKFFNLHYYLAILKSLVTILCLYPIFSFSFNKQSSHNEFWKWILIIRLLLETVGNYYEFVFIKASYHMILGYGLSVTGSVILPTIPSYIAHYLYCFPNKNNPKLT